MESGFFALGLKDLLKGLIVTLFTAVITGVYELIQAGPFLFDWATFKPIVLAAAAAGLAYILKNLFTNSEGHPLTVEKK